MAERLGWYLKGYEENECLEAMCQLSAFYSQMERDRIIDKENYKNYLAGLNNGV